MPFDPETPLPLAVFAAETQGRLRYRLPLVTYTNAFEEHVHTLWMSPQVEAVTGYGVAEWVARPGFFGQIVHPDDRRAVVEEMRRSREELQPFSRDYRLIARDGREVWIHDESVPVLDPTGRPEFIQGYFVDITERKRLEEALRHAQKTEAVGRLAAGISHDFNNILMAIRGYTEIALKSIDEAHPARRPLREVLAGADRAVRLTRQLLAFSRRQELSFDVVDLAEVVVGLESMLRHVAGHDARVLVEASSVRVSADVGQLEQVVVNLVANARDAVGAGGQIEVRVGRSGNYALLTVSDDGCGMPSDVAERIFDPFFTTKERHAGTGLGLSTVQGIVEQSGGTIEVHTAPGRGAEFRIQLPAVDVG